MRDFFSSVKFKILVAIALIVAGFTLQAASNGGLATIPEQIFGAIATPFRQASAAVSDSVSGFFQNIAEYNSLKEENENLKKEINQMREQMVDYEDIKNENSQYQEFLEIKEENPDYKFETASVIGRDQTERYYSFTIDKGSLSGISYKDPVITAEGLVGMVTNVGPNFAEVTTILDVGINVGAYNIVSRDIGTISGTIELAEKGQCKLSFINKDSNISKGDTIVTSGITGIFPKGRPIGRVVEVKKESSGISLYAIVEPFVDIKSVKDVCVIKSFKGQMSEIEEQTGESTSSAGEDASSSEPSDDDGDN